jgi:hypothetical protein
VDEGVDEVSGLTHAFIFWWRGLDCRFCDWYGRDRLYLPGIPFWCLRLDRHQEN